MPETIIIKKYENRRLYDATNSRYVNLEEVAQLVQQGKDVQVVDAASGEDITRQILTQIIAEGAKSSESNFPLDILRQMVIASGRAGQESALRYTKAMLDLYKSTYQAMAPALNPFEFLGSSQPATQEIQKEAPSQNQAAGAKSSGSDEISDLHKRIADLEKAVSKIHPGTASQKANSSKKRVAKPSSRKRERRLPK